jgi:hypothetical protein
MITNKQSSIQVLFFFFFVFLRLPLVLLPLSLSLFLVLYFQSLLVVFDFFDFNVTSGALIPRRSTAHLEGRRISFVRLLFLGLLFVVDVFVVYEIKMGKTPSRLDYGHWGRSARLWAS